MEAFISMRINDLHFTDAELVGPKALSDFWLQASGYRPEGYGRYRGFSTLFFYQLGER